MPAYDNSQLQYLHDYFSARRFLFLDIGGIVLDNNELLNLNGEGV